MPQPDPFIELGGKVSLRPGNAVAGGASIDAIHTAGWAVVSLHFLLLALNQWMLFDQFRAQAPGSLRETLAGVFVAASARAGAADVVALGLATVIALHLRVPSHTDPGTRRVIGVLLISCVPIALHSIGVAGALLSGWQLDVWVASGANASADAVAATLHDALPVVLEPFSQARDVVNVAAVSLFAILLRQVCRFSAWRALASAAAFASALALARTL